MRRFVLLLVCFTVSGAAGLVFQTAWSELLGLVLGASEVAVAVVLGAYMGGLALGASLARRRSASIRRPVRAYALLELVIGLSALGVPHLIRLGESALAALLGGGPLGADGGPGLLAARLAIAFGVLLVPTAAMGATLPILARSAVRDDAALGRRIGALYTANTLGAALGAAAGAFLILPSFGLQAATRVGVGCNLLVFVVALGLDRPERPPEESSASPEPGRRWTWILPAIALSGAISFGDEVLWTRLLAHVLGGSIYGFGAMLVLFLLGLSLGGALAAPAASDPVRARRWFAIAQTAIAVFTLAGLRFLESWSAATRGPVEISAALPVAAAVLLPSAIAIGATFPLAVRIAARSAADAGPATAGVLAWNTVGAIVGALATSLWLLPALGVHGALAAGALGNLALASFAALGPRPRRPRIAAIAGLVAVAIAVLPPRPPWSVLRQSRIGFEAGRVAFHAEGRSASVLVLEQHDGYRLTTNGLPEAKVQPPGARAGRQTVARWLVTLPLAARPEARDLLMVGLGGGVVLEEVPETVGRIAAVELESEVVAANRFLGPLRRADPLADPRVEVHVGDARSVLALTGERFDAIVSQPSHPWTAGSAHLFSREFFSLCADRLRPDGVFVQWIGLPFVDGPIFETLVATLNDSFANVEVYFPFRDAALFLASDGELDIGSSAPRALDAAPELWASLGLAGPEDLLAARLLDAEGSRRFSAGAPRSTDGRNLVQIRSPRVMGRGLDALEASELVADHGAFDPERPDALAVLDRLVAHGVPRIAARLVDGLPDEAERAEARGAIDAALGRRESAEDHLRRALELDPSSDSARSRLLLLYRRDVARGRPLEILDAWPEGHPVLSVARAWRLEAGGDRDELGSLDEALASVDRRSPLWPEATRLRAEWRLHDPSPGAALEAVRLADRLLGEAATPAAHLLRARAGLAAGEPAIALASLWELEGLLRQGLLPPAGRSEALRIAREIPGESGERVHRLLSDPSRRTDPSGDGSSDS